MSTAIGTLVALLVVGGAIYAPLRVLLSRRFPRRPDDEG
jgi:predicted MFS family arabinose efflux permease